MGSGQIPAIAQQDSQAARLRSDDPCYLPAPATFQDDRVYQAEPMKPPAFPELAVAAPSQKPHIPQSCNLKAGKGLLAGWYSLRRYRMPPSPQCGLVALVLHRSLAPVFHKAADLDAENELV